MSDKAICELCGEPMPDGEEMFNYHGYSGPCPKPPLTRAAQPDPRNALIAAQSAALALAEGAIQGMIAEWEKMTKYGSPLAKQANENLRRAREALAAITQIDAALKGE